MEQAVQSTRDVSSPWPQDVSLFGWARRILTSALAWRRDRWQMSGLSVSSDWLAQHEARSIKQQDL